MDMTNNILIIARNEFSSLLNSRVLLIIIAWMLIVVFCTWYGNTYAPPGNLSNIVNWIHMGNDAVHDIIFVSFARSLYWDGAFLAIALGYISMSEETKGKALNTLLVKPVYRDTIITGKLLGILFYVIWVYIFVAAIYLVAMLVYFGLMLNSYSLLFSSYIPEFVGLLPWGFFIGLVCVFFFCSLTMLMCLIFKEKSFALFMSLLSWIFFYLIVNCQSFADYIGFFMGKSLLGYNGGQTLSNMLCYLSVDLNAGILLSTKDLMGNFSSSIVHLFILLFYCFMALILTYIVFLRRDVV